MTFDEYLFRFNCERNDRRVLSLEELWDDYEKEVDVQEVARHNDDVAADYDRAVEEALDSGDYRRRE